MECERGLHQCSLFNLSVGQAQQEVDFGNADFSGH